MKNVNALEGYEHFIRNPQELRKIFWEYASNEPETSVREWARRIKLNRITLANFLREQKRQPSLPTLARVYTFLKKASKAGHLKDL